MKDGAAALRFAAFFGAVSIAICFSRAAGVPTIVLMVAPGVIVPLGLAMVLESSSPAANSSSAEFAPSESFSFPRRVLPYVAWVGATAGVIGWLAPPASPIAVAAAVGHAFVCALAGLLALSRITSVERRANRFGPLHEFAIDVGLGLLPVGAVWFLASRAAQPLGGFVEPVVTFTAAHFHYAGFAAPLIIGGVGRLLFDPPAPAPSAKVTTLYRIAAIAVCAGVPLTAIGIATNHTIEAIAAVSLAAGMLCASALLLFVVTRRALARGSIAAAVLFGISGASLLLTMTLAALFALTSSAGRGSSSSLHGGAIELSTMIDFHGFTNAIGFSLCGLLALTLLAATKKHKRRSPRA